MTSEPTKIRQSEFLVRYRNMRKAVELEEMRKAISAFQEAKRSRDDAQAQLMRPEAATTGQGKTFDLTLFLLALEQLEALQNTLSRCQKELDEKKSGLAETSKRAKLALANARVAGRFLKLCRHEMASRNMLQEWRDCGHAEDATEEVWLC